MISGIIEWTMSWLKQTHKKTNKKLWVSQLQALHNDAVLFLSVCKIFVLALFLWGAVMPCCSAHIFSTQSPLSIWTHLITILISATPHFVHPHCLRSTLSFSRLTISEAATFCIYCLVWSLIWHRVALQAALLHCFQNLRVWKSSEGAGRLFNHWRLVGDLNKWQRASLPAMREKKGEGVTSETNLCCWLP